MVKEQITKWKIAAVCIALLGIVLLVEPWAGGFSGSMAGIISSLMGGVLLSLWIIYGRKGGINKQHIVTATEGWMGFSVIWLLMLWPVFSFLIQEPMITRLSAGFPLQYWAYLAFYTLIANMLSYMFFYKGIRKVQASVAGVIMLLEPVSAALLAAAFLLQPLTFNILAGGALILASNYLVLRKENGIKK
jgi:drug/metabolite transporter (DMT)-like permease